MHNLTSRAKLVAFERSAPINKKLDSTIDNQKWRSLIKNIDSRKYINIIIEYMLIINAGSELNIAVRTSLFLPKDYLVYITLIVYLEADLLE